MQVRCESPNILTRRFCNALDKLSCVYFLSQSGSSVTDQRLERNASRGRLKILYYKHLLSLTRLANILALIPAQVPSNALVLEFSRIHFFLFWTELVENKDKCVHLLSVQISWINCERMRQSDLRKTVWKFLPVVLSHDFIWAHPFRTPDKWEWPYSTGRTRCEIDYHDTFVPSLSVW